MNEVERLIAVAKSVTMCDEICGTGTERELSDAIAAVESSRRATVVVRIPQGETCEGCWLYESDDQGTGCRNGEKPEGEALLNDINGNEDNWGDYRPSWCRSRYGEVKK